MHDWYFYFDLQYTFLKTKGLKMFTNKYPIPRKKKNDTINQILFKFTPRHLVATYFIN